MTHYYYYFYMELLIKFKQWVWKCKAVGASTDLSGTLCHPKVSEPSCSGSIAYRNVSPGTILTHPIKKSINFYQHKIEIEEGVMLPKKIGTVWHIHSCTLCILMGITNPQMQSLWASCQIPSPGRHRKHHEPCSKTNQQFNIWTREKKHKPHTKKIFALERE